MKNYEFNVRNMLAQIALLGSIICLIAYMYSTVKVLIGVLIGLVTGSIYFLYLYRQVENVQVLTKKQAIEHIRGGWAIRLAVILVVLLVITHVLQASASAFIVGFFIIPALLFIQGMLLVYKQIKDTKKQ